MYSVGDRVFYGVHGVCIVQDIQEQSFLGQKKDYYVLSSIQNDSLQLYYPVHAKDSKLSSIISKVQSEQLLNVFKNAPDTWHDRATERHQLYQKILLSNEHAKVAQMINTIIRKKFELEQQDKKLPSQDAQTLAHVLSIFCEELAIGLEISSHEVSDKIEDIILEH